MTGFLETTRAAYDVVAADYARLLEGALAESTFDRAILGAFAELVTGPVVDVGCGPGRITGYLASLGLDVRGIDLSPEMVAVARRSLPDVRFEVGSMTALALRDGELGGVVAWYSVIHIPLEEQPKVYAEFWRVLAPGGALLLAFQAGDGEHRRIESAYGHEGLGLDAWRLSPSVLGRQLVEAGFEPVAQLAREAVGAEKTQQGYVLARKPDVGGAAGA